MSGGSYEYMMSVMKDNTIDGKPMSGFSNTLNSGFEGKVYNDGIYEDVSGNPWPENKYYDLYDFGTTYYGDEAFSRYKQGDATKETQIWYGDYNIFVYDSSPWFVRGNVNTTGTKAGIFGVDWSRGFSYKNVSFRPILVNQ